MEEHHYIKYREARKLKEIGFDELCDSSYETETNWHKTHRPWRNSEDPTEVASPTYLDVICWFRRVHRIKIDLHHATSNGMESFTLWIGPVDNVEGRWERVGHIGSYQDRCQAADKAILEAANLVADRMSDKSMDPIKEALELKDKDEEMDMLTAIINNEYLSVINRSLKKRDISVKEVASRLRMNEKHVADVLSGEMELTIRFITGIRRGFCINLEMLEL